jgi:hypothetical protein
MNPSTQPTAPFFALVVARKCVLVLAGKTTSTCIKPHPNARHFKNRVSGSKSEDRRARF